jgi:hypothetical protein
MLEKGVSQLLGLTPKPTNYEILIQLPQPSQLLDVHA